MYIPNWGKSFDELLKAVTTTIAQFKLADDINSSKLT